MLRENIDPMGWDFLPETNSKFAPENGWLGRPISFWGLPG